ncbi:MAG: 2-oxo acid dehydrogenase subunit E2 [Desulfobacterales bacterium]
MSIEFKLPDPGEGIQEAEITEVLVSEGDEVEEEQSVLVIETDKASVEVPAPTAGIVKKIHVSAGDVVKVGEVLMIFEEADQAGKEPEEREEGEESEPGREKEEAKDKKREEPAEKREEAAGKERPVPATPSTRRLGRELGIDLHKVPASGPRGRVTAEDVQTFAKEQKTAQGALEETTEAEAPSPAAPSLPDFTQWGPVERRALRSVRRTTAKRMRLAWSQIPHVTHQDVADITDMEAFRQKHKTEIERKGGVLTLTAFVLKSTVAALKSHPRFNASIDMKSEEIILKKYYHIGVAVDTEKGLIVPVIRNVDRKSLTELALELFELAERTRNGKTKREDMTGGTFTVTNVGPLGGTGFTPIINYPQVAILGLARAKLQPVVYGSIDDNEIVPRLLLPFALGFDHRIVDGADAARFVRMIIEVLENPERLMMTM